MISNSCFTVTWQELCKTLDNRSGLFLNHLQGCCVAFVSVALKPCQLEVQETGVSLTCDLLH